VNLNITPLLNGALTIGSVTGGTSSTITLGGTTAAATDAYRINLNSGATIAASAPISISTSGTLGVTGFVSNTATATINAAISSTSSMPTMLGATGSAILNVNGNVTGSSGVRFTAGTSGGAGTINVNTALNYTGTTSFNGSSNGTVKLGVDDALPTSTPLVMGFSTGQGQVLDLNGHDQTVGSLASNGGGGSITNNAAGMATNVLTIGGAGTTSFGLVISDGTTRKTALSLGASAGSLTLTTANTYSGDTTLGGGTLVLGASGSIANSPNIKVANGAIFDVSAVSGGFTLGSSQALSGNGTVTGAIKVNGTVAPGASVGTLAVTENVTLNPASTFAAQIDTTTPATPTADLLKITGNLTFSAADDALLTLADLAGTSQALVFGTKLTLISYTGTWNSHVFSGHPDESTLTVGANSFTLNYNEDLGGGVSGVTLSAVPEASSFLFGSLVCGVVGVMYYGRHTRRTRQESNL
jgi:autotransporter-associated beta strand protein